MNDWEKIHQAIGKNIEEEDKAFELAFLRFGEARKWLVGQLNSRPDWQVLDIGYGQGYLSIELAYVLTFGKVVGVDLLHESYTVGATRWIAKQVWVKYCWRFFYNND